MRDDDYLIGTYRTHGHALARGTEPKRVMAELFGRVDGTSGGRGGSMHIFDAAHRFMGGYGIVGGSVGLILVIVILVTALVKFSPTDHPLTDIMMFAAFLQPFVLVLGILSITSEFRHGTMDDVFLALTDRTVDA